MKKRLLFICFITFNLFSSSAFFSQTAKRENFFTSFGLGARAYVLKTPYVSMADDFAATHWNPGGVAFFDNFQLGAMHAKLSLNRQVGFISFIFPVDNSNKIGLSWKGLMINQIQGRTSNTILPDYLFSNIEQLFALTYSRRLWYNFGIGINMNFLHQSLDGVNAGGWGFDSGLLYKVSRNLNIGMVLYDFHSHLKWSTGQLDYFKKTGRMGFCYRLTQNSLFAIGMEGKNQFSASSEVQQIGRASCRERV